MQTGVIANWDGPGNRLAMELARIADASGFDMLFTSEYNGSDAISPLAFVLGQTRRIGIGTCIAQNTARSPAALAMAFQTLRSLAGERPVIAGLGSSTPELTVGWHGRRWTPAYWRMRDTVAIMRQVFAGVPLAHHGRAFQVPWREGDDDAAVAGFSSALPANPGIPIMVGGGSDLMIALAAEIGDGVMPHGSWVPGLAEVYRPMIDKGLKRRATAASSSVPLWAPVDMVVTDDIAGALDAIRVVVVNRLRLGLTGGDAHMGWSGYKDAAARTRALIDAGRIDDAAAEIPAEYIERSWLIGPVQRIVTRWRAEWIDSGCNLIVRADHRLPGLNTPDDDDILRLIRALRD